MDFAGRWIADPREGEKLKTVVVGAGGRLGAALVREWREKFSVTGLNRAQLDLAAPESVRELEFDLLVNAAALTNVDYCEDHRAEAMQLNAEAPRVLAEICREKQARFIHISTDYVFDGAKRAPYTEEDAVKPISVYGESKRAGELQVLQANPEALVVRVSWVFGPDRPSFVDSMLQKARVEEQIAAVADKFSTPTYTRDIAAMLEPVVAGGGDPGRINSVPAGEPGHSHLAFAPAGVNAPGYNDHGVLHLANRGACSWQEYLQWALDCCHRFGVPMKASTVGALSLGEMKNFIARRPVYTVLGTEKYERLTGEAPRDWHEAVEEYVRDHYAGKV